MRVFEKVSELQALVGESIGESDWLTIDQARIDLFARATGDHQWIHTDPERAAKGPYGTTIAHGYLTLSLLPELTSKAFRFDDVKMGVNYGLNRVRFPSPVPVNSRVRAVCKLLAYDAIEGGAQLTVEVTIERDGSGKPVCVAESLSRRYT